MNLYTYCHNNPIRYIDPSGHIVTEIILGLVVIGGVCALTSCDSKTVGKAPTQTSTSNPDYVGTTTQVATSSRTTSQTTRTTTTTTTATTQVSAKKWTTTVTNIEQYKIDFVETIYNKARALETTTKVPAAVVTAQACLESSYGTAIPTDKTTNQFSYNLFGIKGEGPAGSVLCDTFEYYNNQRYDIEDYFMAFNSYDEALQGHSDFLHENSNYDSLFESNDPIKWAYGLQDAGYATAPDYAEQLIGVMNYGGLE